MTGNGVVVAVNGPVIQTEGLPGVAAAELLEVGVDRLPGEAISIREGIVTAQIYDYTGGLRPGDPVAALGRPLSVRLGPGLLGGVFDGTLQPLAEAGDLLQRERDRISARTWHFVPRVERGQEVGPGQVLGIVKETAAVEHRLLVPLGAAGLIETLAEAGDYGADDPLAVIGGKEVGFSHHWPVRLPRPVRERQPADQPLVTGQRVLDLLFPIAKGSTAAVPGGFGTGKTVLLQQIAKWCDADVIVYVGCGERGNEMADVLQEFPTLVDPRTGRSLMDRTVIIANTSNMPVMAREASVHSGITVAEYFRDMGYHALVIADSTSRWAEALREFASRTGQLPAEEGYPASLPSALAAFYERAGQVLTLGGRAASVSVIGAVSPPGGDATEPVTAQTTRFVRSVWSLDRDLAYARHYPAVGWETSFSRDDAVVGAWQAAQGEPDWEPRRKRALAILAESDRLRAMAQLVGTTALPDRERMVLVTAALLREGVLQQSAVSDNDAYCAPPKQTALLEAMLAVHDRCLALSAGGVPAAAIEGIDLSPLVRAREESGPGDLAGVAEARSKVLGWLEALA